MNNELQYYEDLGRTVMSALETPNLEPRRLQIWFRLLGMTVAAQIKMAKEAENAGL